MHGRRRQWVSGCVALMMVVLLGAPLAAAPVPAIPQSPGASYTLGQVQPIGVETNVVTRYGKPGQLSKPLDLVKQMGAGLILEQLRWDKVEHPCGQWDWLFYDELVQEAAKRNLQIMAQMGFNNEQCVAEQFTHSPPDPTRWALFLTTVVTRYKGFIHTWEIWNEPDDTDFWTGTPQQFVDLMRLSYQTIKGIDPSAQVINGACSKLDLVWCNQYLALGGGAYSDVFGFHPYVGQTNFDNGLFGKTDIGHLQGIQGMVNKPVWFTEFGWSSANAGAASNGVGSEQLQARYMVRQYVTMLSSGLNLGPMIWYDFRDDGTDPTDKDAHFGLVQTDWTTPKAGYFAFQQVATRLVGANFVEQRESGAGTAYRFNRNGTVVDVVWGGGRTSLPTESREAQAYNISGQPLPTTVMNGTIQVDIADDPVFVEHRGQQVSTTPAMTGGTMPASVTTGSLPPVSTGGGTSASLPASGGTTGVSTLMTAPGVTMPPPGVGTAGQATASGSGGGAGSWTEPTGWFRLQYPPSWQATRLASFANNVLELDGPDNLLFFVDMYDQQGTPVQTIFAYRDLHTTSSTFTYMDNAVAATQVGGEQGAVMSFTYTVPTMPQAGQRDGAIWTVNHGGKEFDFQIRNVGTHTADVAVLINSVTFLR